MKPKLPFPFASFALLASAQLLSGALLRAQAPPGPMALAQPKDDDRPATTERPRALEAATKESLKGSWN